MIPLLSHCHNPTKLILQLQTQRSGQTAISAYPIHSSTFMSILLSATAPTHSPPNALCTMVLTFVPITNLRMPCLTAQLNVSATTSVLATTLLYATVPIPSAIATFLTSLSPKAHPSRQALPSPSLAPLAVPPLPIFTSPSSTNASLSTHIFSWIIFLL